jgi:hypothetical protein
VFNPKGNGNCGFQCLSKALGYNRDGWFQVRKELVKEASNNKRLYSREQGGEKAMNKILNKINVESKKTKILESKKTKILESQWLSKLSHGQIIANKF